MNFSGTLLQLNKQETAKAIDIEESISKTFTKDDFMSLALG